MVASKSTALTGFDTGLELLKGHDFLQKKKHRSDRPGRNKRRLFKSIRGHRRQAAGLRFRLPPAVKIHAQRHLVASPTKINPLTFP